MTKITAGLVAFVFIVAGVLAGAPAGAEQRTAVSFVDGVAQAAVRTLSSTEMTDTDKHAVLSSLVHESFDLKAIGRYVAAAPWKLASEAQKREYQDLFGTYFIHVYARLLDGYEGQSVAAIAETKIAEGDSLVTIAITESDQTSIRTDLRVRGGPDDYRVIDVMIGGVSMIATQRAEFGSITRRRGFDGLLALLRTQTEKYAAAGGEG